LFESVPVVDAYAGFDYIYLAKATDPDGDTLTYSVVTGPTGLAIDSSTGLVTWQSIPANLVGQNVSVKLAASDGAGGVAEQNYLIAVHANLGNTPPIIITSPNTQYTLADGISSEAIGDVNPTSVDLQLELGDGTIAPITLNYPNGDSLFTADVVIALDSSGSMINNVSWIPDMVDQLEAALIARGITNNRYSIVRFTGNSLLYAVSPKPSRVSIYGPDNQLVDSVFVPDINLGWAYVGDMNLPATGEYYVIVESENGSSTGEYSFEAELIQKTFQTTALTLNEVYTDEIDAWDETHEYTFTLANPTRVELDVSETFAYYHWTLETPSGIAVNKEDLKLGQRVLDLEAGSYTLSLTSERFEFIPYQFRLNDLTNTTTVTPGTAVTGTIADATQSKVFQFDAVAGDRYEFDLTTWTGSGQATWRLLDPYGVTLFDNNIFTDQAAMTLPLTGEYTIILEGHPDDSTPSISYSFDVIEATETATSLTLEQQTTGSIDTAGETDTYAFTLSADGYVVFHPYGNDATTQWTLQNAGGEIVSAQGFDAGNLVQKLTAGDYEIAISKTAANTGGYDFALHRFSSATAVTDGVQEDATLTPAKSTALYTFSATAGDRFSFDSIGWNGASGARWMLYDELGQELFDDVVANDQATMTLTAGGGYTIIVAGDPSDTATNPTFSFEVNSTTAATPNTLTGTALSLNTPTTGTISTYGEIDKFTFTLTDTTRVFLDAISRHTSSSSTDPEETYWKLESEYETIVAQAFFRDSGESSFANGAQFLELPAGDYQLSVAIASGGDEDTGDYEFQVLDLDSPVTTLTIGTAYSGSLSAARKVQSYQFSADAGDPLYFDNQAFSGGTAKWTLVDPLGNILFSQSLATDHSSMLMPFDGTYTLLLEHTTSSATFTMLVDEGSTSSGTPLTLDATTTGSISTSTEVDVYAFTLTGNKLVLFDSRTNTADLAWSLTGPGGEVISGKALDANEAPVWLSAGDYELSIHSASTGTGAYNFSLLDLDSATTISPGTNYTGTLSPANSAAAFRISATSGDWFQLGIEIDDIAFLQVYDSRGRLIRDIQTYHEGGNDYVGDGEQLAMPETSSYYVVLQGAIGEAATSNPYDFSLDLYYPELPVTKTFAWNTVLSDTLTNKGEIHEYDFTLDLNSLVNVDSMTNDADIAWRIVNSTGTTVATGNMAAGDAPVALSSGTYTLVIDGIADATGDYSVKLVNLLTHSTYLAPDSVNTVTGTLSPAGSSLAYQFQAGNGESYDFEAIGYSGSSSASWKLVNSSGTILFDNAITADETGLTISTTGSFWLLIDGDVADSTTDPEFEFKFSATPTGGGGGSYTLNGTAISLNTTVSGSISQGSTVPYNFSLGSDSLVYFDSLHQTSNSDENVWTLDGALGNYVYQRNFEASNASNYSGPSNGLVHSLPAGGYNLVIANEEDSDNFQFQVIDLPSAAQTFTLGSTVSGSLSPSRKTHVYKFSANAADLFDFDSLTTTGQSNRRWRLIDPQGTILLTRGITTDETNILLEETGTYYLLIEGYSRDGASSSSYSFEFSYLGQGTLPPKPLMLGTSYNGNIQSGSEVDEYSFTLSGTTKLFFDSFTNDADFEWVIEDTSSNVIVSATSFTASDGNDVTNANLLKSLSAGDYILKVQTANSATGTYGFRLVNFDSAASAITGGTTGIQQLTPGNGTQLHTLAVTSGDRLIINPTLWTGSSEGQFRLMTASGTVLISGALNTSHVYEVQATETLTLLVEGDVADESSQRSYQLDFEAIDITGTSTLTMDVDGTESVYGNIASAGDIQEYTLTTGSTPMRLYFEWVGANTELNMRLKNADGKTLLTDAYAAGLVRDQISTVTLAANQTYSFLIDAGTTTTGNFHFRIVDLDAQPELDFDVNVEGDWSASGERDVYRFTAQKDDRLFIRMSVWGSADDLRSNVGSILLDMENLVQRGLVHEWEDGYATISGALHDMVPREYATKQFVMITDEDRDNYYPAINKEFIQYGMLNSGYSLHTILDMQTELDGNGNPLLGVTGNNANAVAYVSDGEEGYIEDLASNYTFEANDIPLGYGESDNQYQLPSHIQEDYVDLAYAVGGSVWNINEMGSESSGYSVSFTDAFAKAVELDIARKLEISLIPTDPFAPVQVLSPTFNPTSMSFDVEFTGDGAAHQFDLQFVRTWNNDLLLGSVPVSIETKYFYDADAIDADNDELTYTLTQGSEYGATIDSETGELHWMPSATGDYDFTVVVTDGFGGQDVQSWTVTVSSVYGENAAPEFTTSGPHTLTANRQYAFLLEGTDANGDTLRYQLVDDPLTYALPDGLVIDGVTGIATWTPTNAQIGTHEVLARVLDGKGGVDTQVITLTVEPVDGFVNNPPVITSTPANDIIEGVPVARIGEIFTYEMEAYDPEGDNIGFDITYAPDGVAIHPSTGLLLWRPTADQFGDHQVILRVRDDLGGVTLQSFSIRVLETSGIPQITSTPDDTFETIYNTVLEIYDDTYTYDVTLLDPDGEAGDVLDIVLVNTHAGVSIPATATLDANGAATVQLTFTPGGLGLYPIHIRVTDEDGKTVNQQFDLQVFDPAINNAPVITSASTQRDVVQGGVLFVSRIIATDPDDDAITYSLLSGPTGMEIDPATGVITWQTETGDINDPLSPYTYQVRVTDARGATTDSTVLNLDVTLEMPNAAPVITTSAVPTFVLLNDLYTVDLEATDAENDLLGWALTSSPTGMTINAETGVINWIPEAGDEGEYTITAIVVDPYGGRDEISWTLLVRGVNTPPVITSLPDVETIVSQDYQYRVTAYDPEGGSLSYALIGAEPGMSIDSSGLFEWTPGTQGTYTVTIQVTDALGMGTQQVFDLDVVSTSTIVKPKFIGWGPGSEAWNGIPYTADLETNWEEVGSPTVNYRLIDPPAGMSINASTGVISWTPNETPGTLKLVKIGASDGDSNYDDEKVYAYQILVQGNTAPDLSAIPNASVTAGGTYSWFASFTDIDEDPVEWSLDTAPSGMVIDQYGQITWVTTPSDVSGTPYNVTVRITDPNDTQSTPSLTDTISFTITVTADITDPEVDLHISPETVFENDQVLIHIAAWDDGGIDDIVLEIDGQPVLVNDNGEHYFTATDIQNGHEITVTVTDLSGNSTVITESITVGDPNVTGYPTATLNAIAGDMIESLTDIIGTIDSDDNPLNESGQLTWGLTLIESGSGTVRELASGTDVTIVDGILAEIDPTRLPNGTYTLKLSVTNGGLFTATDTQQIVIDNGVNKAGNFNVSFLDLELTMSNLPISVTRSYDTLRANEPGDFGYGWGLDLANTSIDIDYGIDNPYNYQPFTDGTEVTVTLQDGSTHSFTFAPTATSYIMGVPTGDWLPTFQSHDLFDGIELLGMGGPFRKVNTGFSTQYMSLETGNIYNPKRPEFGNSLTLMLRDQTQYTFNATTGKLTEIRDTHGNTITITDYGIFHSAGRSIQFVRNQQGFITEIVDPAGKKIFYSYDQDGNLISVKDREEAVTQFIYHDSPGIPEHYLKEIISPNGVKAVENIYDSNGVLTEVLDADDNSVEVAYLNRNLFSSIEQEQLPTATRKEILTDQLGAVWTTYFDDRGNKLAEVDPLGGMMLWEYSDQLWKHTQLDTDVLVTYEGINLLVKETKMIGGLDGISGTPTQDPPDLVTTYSHWHDPEFMFDPPNIPELAETKTGMVITITDPRGNQTRRHLNRFGRVIMQIDALGNTVKYNYQQKTASEEFQTGNLQVVVDPFGKFTTMKYDGQGNVTQLGNSFRLAIFGYNAYGELTSATDPLGNVTTFDYDAYGRQTDTGGTWTNPEDSEETVNLESSTDYDDNGRVTGTTDALSNTTSTVYNDIGQVVSETDEYGRTMTYRYDDRGLVLQTIYDDGTTSESVYDVKGREVFSTSAHRPEETARGTEYVYDELGRATTTKQITGMVITVTEVGTTGIYESAVTTNGTVEDTYTSVYDDISGYLLSSTDSNGNVTSYTYDDFGQQIEVERVMGATTLTTTYEYDSYGRQTKVTDPYGRDTHYVYDSYGRQIKTIHHTNAESTTTYDDYGRVTSRTSYTGVVTAYEYDNLGRQIAMEVTADGVTNRTEYEYNNYGQRSLVRDAHGNETLYRYDAYGRQVSYTQVVGVIDDAINLETDDLTYYTTYDVHGNVLTETNALGLTRTFTYDSEGRLSSVTLPQVADTQNGDTLTAPVYEYDYDVYGNMTKITDPLGRETDFTFSVDNQQLTRTLPVSGTEESWYDDEGRNWRHEDFEGNVVDSLFTDEGLLDELQYYSSTPSPGATPEETVSYTYDDQYRKTSMTDDRGTTYYEYNDDGRITQIESPEGIINYEYDDLTGNRTRVTTGDPLDVENDFRYTYDSLGHLKTVEVHERNDSVLSTPEVTTYTYDAVGNLIRTDLANGVITTYEYDDLYRLDVLTHFEPDGTPENLADNDKLAEYDYTVRADGRRTGVTETRWDNGAPLVDTFGWIYDDLGRLVTEVFDSHDNALDFEANYTYDLVGNRLEKTVDQHLDSDIDETYTYTYNTADQLLTETKVVDLVDDGSNGQTDDTTTTYTYTGTLQTGKQVIATYSTTVISDTTFDYNLHGRLEAATIDTYTSGSISKREVTSYEYDDKGIRVSAHHTIDEGNDGILEVDETTTYLNDPMNHTGYSQVIEEVTVDNLNSQAEVERLIYTLGLDILQQVKYDVSHPTGLNSFMLYDGHGSMRMLTDMLAAVTVVNSIPQIFTYDAYGIAIGFSEAQAATRFLYSGEQFDPRIQQQYLRARYYDAITGRFNRLDPFFGNLRDPQSLHKYLYTHADPVNAIDPSGLFSITGKQVVSAISAELFSIMGGAALNALQAWEDGKTGDEILEAAKDGAVGGAIAGGIVALAILGGPAVWAVLGPGTQSTLAAFGLSLSFTGVGAGLASVINHFNSGRPISGTVEAGSMLAGSATIKFSGYGKKIRAWFGANLAGPKIKWIKWNPTSGRRLFSTPGKTTTIIGRFDSDMQHIKRELNPPEWTTAEQARNAVGQEEFNMLNMSDEVYNANRDNFWEDYNKPWLDGAIERGDDIFVASDPLDYANLINTNGRRTAFGEEVKYLKEKGFEYDPVTSRFFKPSETSSFLNWW
ncbi:MAG: hypothetical protein CMJ46_08850, partial [Planctomyces sp.]|nr:hypothetical protein [Planctomyces sp.]